MNKKEFYNSLSDEVKAKIKACKTEEEMLKVLEDEKIELDPELLDGVSGGQLPVVVHECNSAGILHCD